MPKNFWTKLDKPILALAPLAGFTDRAFRELCREFGAQVTYSEMVSATALFYNSQESLELMAFDRQKEKDFVVQLFGSEPEHFAVAARIIEKKIKPAGIDLNCGCPVKKVLNQGAGAALMKDLKRTREIIKVLSANTDRPISLKIRAGNGRTDALKFLEALSDLDIKAVMIHGRTLAGAFSGPIGFELIKQARNYFPGIILANGGLDSPAAIQEMLAKTGADGVGLARGALGNPWIFKGQERPETAKIYKLMLRHARVALGFKGSSALIELRKHLVYYVNGLPGASRLRAALVRIETWDDLKQILR